MKISVISKMLAAVLTLALLFVSMPVIADSGLTSGFAKIKDWDKVYQAFSFSSGQVTSSGGDFFMSPRGIHVFESPGIIDMGLMTLDAIGEAPASGYVEMAAPLDGHSYVVRSNGKYGKFYLEDTYDWLDPVEYGISWVYQTNGTRTFEGASSPAQPTTSGQTGTGAATGCTYEQYIAAYNKLTSLMSQGKGDTPEAQAAYAEYAKVKACYESGSSGTGTSATTGQPGTGGESGCTYQDYITAYNKLNYLNSHGQANTPESKLAYEQYARIKACYESGSSGTGQPSTSTTTPTTPTTTTPTITTPATTPAPTSGITHLSCTNKDNEEKGCGPFFGAHTYLFGHQNVTSVFARFDTGRGLGCRSAVKFEIYQSGVWKTIKTVDAVSSSGNSEIAPIEVQVPVNDTISGFRISDGCVCCIDSSEITVYGGQSIPSSTTPTTTSTSTSTSTTSTTTVSGTALIAESRTVAPGSTVQVPVNFQNAQNVGSLGFKLAYNPAVVQVIKVSKGSLLAPATFTSNVQSDYIIFGFAMPQSISGTGSAAVVEFQALGAEGSKSPLTLTEITATGSSGAALSVNSVNGELSIGQKQLGDADGDGKLSVLDALIALKMYVQSLPLDLTADINKDGRVTPEDARLILEKAKP